MYKIISKGNFINQLHFKSKHKETVVGIITALLIFLFLYTATSKLLDLNKFSNEMHNQTFPMWLAQILTWSLPPIELIICVALFFGRTRFWGLLASSILMFCFSLYTLLVLLHAFDRVPCSCGGVINSLTWSQHLVFNLSFLSLSILASILEKRITH